MKIFFAALLSVSLIAPVYADGERSHRGVDWGHREHHEGWGWRGDWIFPTLIGGAILFDLSQPRTRDVQPEPIYAQPESIYASPSSAQVPVWYFCPAANGYYPYVTFCPSGWQTMPATPPTSSNATPVQ